jgi:hypothetical protein
VGVTGAHAQTYGYPGYPGYPGYSGYTGYTGYPTYPTVAYPSFPAATSGVVVNQYGPGTPLFAWPSAYYGTRGWAPDFSPVWVFCYVDNEQFVGNFMSYRWLWSEDMYGEFGFIPASYVYSYAPSPHC